jgi:hypothetical protein
MHMYMYMCMYMCMCVYIYKELYALNLKKSHMRRVYIDGDM